MSFSCRTGFKVILCLTYEYCKGIFIFSFLSIFFFFLKRRNWKKKKSIQLNNASDNAIATTLKRQKQVSQSWNLLLLLLSGLKALTLLTKYWECGSILFEVHSGVTALCLLDAFILSIELPDGVEYNLFLSPQLLLSLLLSMPCPTRSRDLK